MVNEEIKENEVRLIDTDGSIVGIMSSREALQVAYQKNLDMVMIAPTAKPPVCKIMDYNKYVFDMAKKEILPSIERYVAELVTTVSRKKKLDAPVSARYESTIIEKLSGLEDLIYDRTEELEKSAAGLKDIEDIKALCRQVSQCVRQALREQRTQVTFL